MSEKVYTYRFYSGLYRRKTLGILAIFATFGALVGLSNGELNALYILSGLTNAIPILLIASQIRTSYTLKEDEITIAINLYKFQIPSLRRTAKYDDITAIEWEPDPPYNIGHNRIGDLESHHYNLGGQHIRIKQANNKDITFSATKNHLHNLQERLKPITQ